MADPTLARFSETGALLNGHFRLTSGLHSATYLQCAKVLQYPQHAAALGAELAEALRPLAAGAKIGLVASPAIGGLIIGHEVARHLGVRFVFTERDGEGKMCLRRGFAVEPGEVALVVEDVITTGGSTKEVIDLLVASGVQVAGAGSIIDRSGGAAEVGVARKALATLQVVAYAPESCPLCQQGLPVVKPGSRPTAG